MVESVVPRELSISMEWKLKSVEHPKNGDEYTMMVFISDADGNIPRHYFNAILGESVELRTEFVYAKGVHPYLHVYMYLTTDDEDGARGQSLFACGNIHTHDLMSGHSNAIVLWDIDHRKQAVLSVKVKSPPSVPPFEEGDSPLLALTPVQQKMISVFSDELYAPESGIDVDIGTQGYTHVVTPLGELPLICFAIMCTMIHPAYYTLNPTIEIYPLWTHWLYLAIRRLGYNYKEVVVKNHNTKAPDIEDPVMLLKIFHEMITLVSRGHLFEDDNSRGKDGMTILIEWWVNLALFPNPGLISRDCEDAAGFTYQLIHIFAFLPLGKSGESPKDPRLRFLLLLQGLIRQHTAFITLGTQYTGEPKGYMPHAYVTMHESVYIDRLRDGTNHTESYLPSVLFDTVNYIDGVWDEESWTKDTERVHLYEIQEEFIDNHEHLRRYLKPNVPTVVINENQQYGPVSHMIAANHRGQGLHWVLKQPPAVNNDVNHRYKFKVGYPLEDLMLKKAEHGNVREVFSIDKEQVREFHETMQNLPWSDMIELRYTPEDLQVHSQAVQDYTHTLSTIPQRLAFVIRTLDYKGGLKTEIDGALSTIHGFDRLLRHEYHVTSEISFTELVVVLHR